MTEAEAKKPQWTKAWWDSHASKKTDGTKVGECLEAFHRHCTDPTAFKTEKEFGDATEACLRLEEAIRRARAKCGKVLQKETLMCLDVYARICKEYKDKMFAQYNTFREVQMEEERLARKAAKARAHEPDWVKPLGLNWPCTLEDVSRAFRKLALPLHPDRHGNSPEDVRRQAEESLKVLSEHYADAKKHFGANA